MIEGYKLVRLLKDGSLAPLFIDRSSRFVKGKWHRAKEVPTKGFSFRPGFHACASPVAPHLSSTGRVWVRCLLKGVTRYTRPECQGGEWYTAKQMKVIEEIPQETHIELTACSTAHTA